MTKKAIDLVLQRIKEVQSFEQHEVNKAIVIELRAIAKQSMGMDNTSLDQLLTFVEV
jgi:hypothetical protein